MMTPRQRQLYDFIDAYFVDFGYSPTVREMRDGIGCKSTSEVHRMLTALKQRGLVGQANQGISRGYFVKKSPEQLQTAI